ncbi:helix-turn-helix transcriptional regulator [Streptomyces sp. UH6]|uniref:helix-turn-helix domain-containing protein n=1 Tax=Streptomyces sp. UH6 TaxID=2748379 RepID=UPI00211DFE87|nr:helix-turn-helix transcriptional regulator [Streptomyces sp. UH6]
MRAALRAHDFGAVFRLARERAGISYSKLAAECGIKPERVGTLARGQGRIESFGKIATIADALRVPGHLVGLAARLWETAPSRREVIGVGAAVGLASALGDLHRQPVAARVGERDVQVLRERTARLRRLDDVLGGGDTHRVFVGGYQRTRHLLRAASCTERVGRALLALAAEQAQQAGWACFDAGRHQEAGTLYQESRSAAEEADAGDLAGNALAYVAYQTADRRSAVAIAAASCDSIKPSTSSAVRALLWERYAWACACAGMADAADRALAQAREAVADGRGEAPPDWAAWVDGTEVEIMTGRCWAELRRPLRAVPVLTAALARVDDAHARDKALYSTWLAQAYAAAGEVEAATEVLCRASDLADGVASARPRLRIAAVVERLRADYGEVPSVAELVERTSSQSVA